MTYILMPRHTGQKEEKIVQLGKKNLALPLANEDRTVPVQANEIVSISCYPDNINTSQKESPHYFREHNLYLPLSYLLFYNLSRDVDKMC